MKRTTIAKDFEAKQANPSGTLDRTMDSEAPLAATVVGTTGGSGADWSGNGIAADQFASKDELGELRQAMAMKVGDLCRPYVVFRSPLQSSMTSFCALMRMLLRAFLSQHPAQFKRWTREPTYKCLQP